MNMSKPRDLDDAVGRWSGTWSTWLQPGVLHDTSAIDLDVDATSDGWTLTYSGSIGDDDVTGRMLVSPDGTTIRWTDTWHTGGEEQLLIGEDSGAPSYRYGPDDAPWTWSIAIEARPGQLVIRHFNAPPDNDPALAVEMNLTRPDE